MPSIRDMLQQTANGSLMRLNNQTAQITLPPLMKTAEENSSATGTIDLVAQDSAKMYVVNGYDIYVTNTAGTACQTIAIKVTDFWTGKELNVAYVYITPNVVGVQTARLTGLNIPCQPGTSIKMYNDAAPGWQNVKVFYTEVSL